MEILGRIWQESTKTNILNPTLLAGTFCVLKEESMNINWALLAAYIFGFIVEIGGPVALGIWLLRKYKSSWILLVTGVLSFAISQLIHIPAISGVQTLFSNGTLPSPSAAMIPLVNGLIVGLLAAVCQESVRWIGFKVNEKRVKPFRSSMIFALGQGGAELLVVGALLAANLGSILFYNGGAQIAKGVSPDTVQSVLAQIANYWASPWYYGVLGVFEHLVAFSGQVVFTIFIWKSVARHQPLWFLVAFFYHIIVDGMTTFLSGMNWGLWQIEGVSALILLLNVLIVYSIWNNEGGLDAEYEDEDDEDEEDEETDEDDEELEEDVDEDEDEEVEGEETPAK